jgi:hypothetical protein
VSMRWPRGLVLLAGVAGLLLTASCTSSAAKPNSIASSQAAEQARAAKLQPVLVQCFASHGLIPASDLAGQSWYQSGKVTLNNAFYEWWREHEGLGVKGRELVVWLNDAASQGTWPTSICGPMPSSSSLRTPPPG